MKVLKHPVYPIPPSFLKQKLEYTRTVGYLQWLNSKGAKRVMTTAGTSQFNLLSVDEVFHFNRLVVNNWGSHKILGLPALGDELLIPEIDKLNNLNAKYTSILILFPERYYNDEQIIKFFKKVCERSNYPVYLHGNPLKKGNGGTYEYTAALLKKLSDIPNFIGIKEEYSSIDLAMKYVPMAGDLEVIVAGGSMRRFWALAPYGANSFLTGVGSFNPKHSEYFFNNFKAGDLERCLDVIEYIEKPLFRTFMEIGWHASMRTSLQNMTFLLEDRKPFVELSPEQKTAVLFALNEVKE